MMSYQARHFRPYQQKRRTDAEFPSVASREPVAVEVDLGGLAEPPNLMARAWYATPPGADLISVTLLRPDRARIFYRYWGIRQMNPWEIEL